jgi:hypothetical protein
VSDLARVYPNGKELALGGQSGGVPEVAGQEKASVKNAGLAHAQPPGQELAK